MQLQAPQLEFLLEDLSRKLQYSLSASASSRRSFLKVSDKSLLKVSGKSLLSSNHFSNCLVPVLPSPK